MNILIVNWAWYPTGGDWTYISIIKKSYEENGHKVIPFSVKNDRNESSEYEKYFIKEIDYKKINNKKSPSNILKVISKSIYSFEARKKINLLLEENNIDIAQFIGINCYQTPSIIPVLKKYHIPIIWRLVDYKLICPNTTLFSKNTICQLCKGGRFYNCIQNKCKKNSFSASIVAAFESYFYKFNKAYNEVDLFSFQSKFTRDKYVEFGFDKNMTFILPNPVEHENVTPNFKHKNYILFYGRLEKCKGIFTLLKSMKQLPGIELRVIGDGSELDDCMKFVNKNLMKNVRFLGTIWDHKLCEEINNCSFVIVPSEWYEPSPYSILQSFAAGKAVIGSNLGGIPDLIIDKYNGLLFKPGDYKELANKIKSLSNNENLIIKYGKNARNTIKSDHTPQVYYKKSIKIFESLIAEKGK